MPTYKCTAECEHCGTLSSRREKTWLGLDNMLSAIEQAAQGDYKVVVFTGGEPTLAGKDLLTAIARADALGLSTRIVSNAHWAATDALATRMVKNLVDAGLREINFSTGDQHARFVPLDNIVRATRAAAASSLSAIVIMVETVRERTITAAAIEERPDFQAIRREHPRKHIEILESPWMPLEPMNVSSYRSGSTVNGSNVALRTGCTSILSTTAIQADGRIGACCGLGMRTIPELQVGTVRDTKLADADRNAADDFLKHWIRVEGPERILAWAAEHDPSIAWEDMYAHRCQACMRLYKDPAVRKVIAEHHREKLADVVVGEWLLYDYPRKIDPTPV
ncbi:MAG: radical SAM protein [Candidatus Eremiobacteraeota bacterium]|nr:radical SAM protein [Candidatus Eremiobacteraeota bacterium]